MKKRKGVKMTKNTPKIKGNTSQKRESKIGRFSQTFVLMQIICKLGGEMT